jgi:hypothetical protein
MPFNEDGTFVITTADVDIAVDFYRTTIGETFGRQYVRHLIRRSLQQQGVAVQVPSRLPHEGCRHRKYLLECAEFDRLLARANGSCERCGATRERTPQRRLYIDHDHATGRTRGMLCPSCNSQMGAIDNGRAVLDPASQAYLNLSAAPPS